MGANYVDVDKIRSIARDLDQVATEVDSADRAMPETLDAGPFTPGIMRLVEAVAANTAVHVMRVRAAAEGVRKAADQYEDTEDHHVETLHGFLRDLSGEDPDEGR
ncbi:hypothetical protein ABN034_20705 [Actinopolymorpha sp. B11F2]|uniref:hypothetical protein n=1 Tax=Actinopolymorpha sp. B11F2 TaxID=3160862 RepID=UPI0032E3F839